MKNVQITHHPLIQHKLTLMRDKRTATDNFRRLLREISMMMVYEATRDLPLAPVAISTPLADIEAPAISGKKLCLVSILRAGSGMVDGMLDVLPAARVGHIGLYRDARTLQPVEYFYKVPDDINERLVLVADPMLATGHSAIVAVQKLKDSGATSIKLLTLLSAPEGVEAFCQAHSDVMLYTAAIDEKLNDHGYIIPGLGDAGDRLYGTK